MVWFLFVPEFSSLSTLKGVGLVGWLGFGLSWVGCWLSFFSILLLCSVLTGVCWGLGGVIVVSLRTLCKSGTAYFLPIRVSFSALNS